MLRMLKRSRHYVATLFCLNLAIFYLYDYLLRVMPSVLSHGLHQAYHLSYVSYGYFCASFYFIYVPMQLVIAVLVDRIAFRRLLMFSAVICAFGCYLFANAEYFVLALTGRLLMGLGASSILVAVLKSVALRVSERRFTLYLGIVICVGMLGGLLMDSVLVFVLRVWGWRLACFVLAAMGLFFAVINLRGATLEMAPVHKREKLKNDIARVLFYLTDRKLWVRCLIGALLYLPIAGFAESWGIAFLKQNSQLSHLYASVDMSMIFLGFAIGAPVLGWLYDRTSQYQLILTVGAVGVTILSSIILYVPELFEIKLALLLMLLGFFSSSTVVVLAMNRRLAGHKDIGKVFAVTNFIMMLAGGAAWLVGTLVHFLIKYAVLARFSIYSLSDYQLALVLLPCGSMLALLLSFYVYNEAD